MNDYDAVTSARQIVRTNSALVLGDGTTFFGFGIGIEGETVGEICFNTSMTGYQEILTDPSYAGQIITFTFPHIGNTGINDEDIESRAIFAKGLILRDGITHPSNFRSQSHLNDYLIKNGITGITGVDTRALTRHIRLKGAQNAVISFYGDKKIDRKFIKDLQQKAISYPTMKGKELAKTVTCDKPYEWNQTAWKLGEGYGELKNAKYHVVAMDFGIKYNILRCLSELGCKVTVVPAKTKSEEILALNPDGIFLSNGPGDPAATGKYAKKTIKKLVESNIPIFGICLGHQLLSLALGCKTTKMHQGHRGANHPVKNNDSKVVEITSQNHGFVVKKDALPRGVKETHTSLFDGTLEGIKLAQKPVFSVQHHPEASPGPKDSHYLFNQFIEMIKESKKRA